MTTTPRVYNFTPKGVPQGITVFSLLILISTFFMGILLNSLSSPLPTFVQSFFVLAEITELEMMHIKIV